MKRCQSITKSGLLENYRDIISIQQRFPSIALKRCKNVQQKCVILTEILSTGLSSKPFNFFGITNGVVPLEALRKNSKYDTKF